MFGLMTFVLRSPGDPTTLVPAVRQAVAEIEPDRPLANIAPMKGIAVAFLGDLSRYVLVLGAFALVATLLAAIVVYGVTAYLVAQRTREIAIRVALGASRRDIVALVGRRALVLVSLGLICGFTGSLALARVIESQLWGVTTSDATTFGSVSLLLSLVALLACLIPVRRAVQVDPTTALRHAE